MMNSSDNVVRKMEVRTFNSFGEMFEALPSMTEDELRACINHEVSTYRRGNIIARMHMRYCKLRMKRERFELINGLSLL